MIKQNKTESMVATPFFEPLGEANPKWENEFFERLRDKLDEILPKTNQDHPEIPSKGNRSGAISLNAHANIIFKDILDKAIDKTLTTQQKDFKWKLQVLLTDPDDYLRGKIKDLIREIK